MRVGRVIPGFAFVLAGALAAQGCGGTEVHPVAGSASPTKTPSVTPAPTSTPPEGPGGGTSDVGPWPIVLMHGMAGWTQVAGVEYFNGIPEALRADGWTVFTTSVDPFQAVEVRAGQAASQIDQILRDTGAQHLILIGHSQGGLDARYLVSTLGYGDRVKSVATFATPHHGSKLADVALGLAPGDVGAATAALSSALLGAATGTHADLQAQIHELSQRYCDETFNPSNPDDPRVEYFSATGVSQPWWFVNPNTTDVANPLLVPSWWIVDALQGANDGFVPVQSGKWGTFLGVVPADHFDEVGQPPLSPHPAYDQVAYFRALAAFLEGAGPNP